MNVEDLGGDSFFEEAERAEGRRLGLRDFSIARVTSEFKEAYHVQNEHGEYLAKITGKQMFRAQSREDYPAVGDFVLVTVPDARHAVIHAVLPRRTAIKRRQGTAAQIIAANIDIAFVVESADRDYSLNRFERYFSIARDGGVAPAIILNKIDLLSEDALDGILAQLKDRFHGIDIITTSTVNNEGLLALAQYIVQGTTYCFLGSSGVGKSSLINALLGAHAIKTGAISSYSGRGTHVTTRRQMYILAGGGIVIDNPGMREVGMTDAGHGIDAFFDEISALARHCKYADCTHTHEPGCEVLRVLQLGKLNKDQYANFVTLKGEAAYYAMNDAERREKDRQFGKFIKSAKKTLKDLE